MIQTAGESKLYAKLFGPVTKCDFDLLWIKAFSETFFALPLSRLLIQMLCSKGFYTRVIRFFQIKLSEWVKSEEWGQLSRRQSLKGSQES